MAEIKIWKYQIPIIDDFKLPVSIDFKILSFQLQNNIPCLWIECNPDAETFNVNFKIIGTGHSVPENYQYIGTVVMPPNEWGTSFVWHLYIERT